MSRNARAVAEHRCIENLLSCYCREIAVPAGEARFTAFSRSESVLNLSLPFTGRELGARVSTPSLTLGFECTGPCWIEDDGRLREASWRDVAEAIIAEVAARHGAAAHPELLGLIEDSLGVTERLAAQPHRLALGFIESEQALTYGHPYHPSPKSRAGLSPEELERYSPELGARFRLHWFGARAELVEQGSIADRSCVELLEAQAGASFDLPSGFVPLPVHPWQAGFVRQYPLVRRALENGDLIDLGERGREFFATSSVRTLYSPGAPYFVKTALNIRITNCIRRNAPHELQCSLNVSKWMREAMPCVAAEHPGFHALEEPAWLTLRLRDGDAAERERISESFGLMLREAAPVEADASSPPLLAAALFGNRSEGRTLLRRALGNVDRARWLARYVELLVFPCLRLFFEHGLMFEPHLQNVLVALRDGMPERVLLRDFDNGKLVSEWFDAKELARLPRAVRDELAYGASPAWKRFVYCLFVNHLAEVLPALAEGRASVEAELWEVLRAQLVYYQGRYGNARSEAFISELITAASLPGKGNLVTRVFKRADRNAGFFAVPNPLAQAASTAARGVGDARP